MTTIGEMIVRLLADTSHFDTNMAEAATTVKASSDAMASSYQNAMQSFSAFEAIQKSSLGTAESVAAAQEAINAAQATGAFTAEELAAKQALVDAAMLKVGKETQAASGFLSMFTRNSRTMYSTSALITDAMTGQFSRMRREVAALGNETGVMATAFKFAVSPAGLVSIALAAVAAMALKAHDEIRSLQGQLYLAGEGSTITTEQLKDMEAQMRASGASAGRASDALKAIAASGRFTAAEFVDVGKAAAAMADMSGEKIDKVVSSLVKFQEDPVKAIKSLTAAQEFLTDAQAKEIKQLQQTQGPAAAAAATFHILAKTMTERDAAFNASGDAMDKWRAKEGNFWSSVFNGSLGDSSIKQQMDSAANALKRLASDSGAVYGQAANGQVKLADAGRLTVAGQHEANRLLKEYNDLVAKANAQQKTLADQDAAQAKAKKAIDNALGGDKNNGIGALEKQFQQQEAAAHASHDKMKVDAADYWNAEANNANNSIEVQAQAWQKYIEARSALDAQGLATDNGTTRKREENARKVAEAAKRAEEGRVRAVRQADQEIRDEIAQEATRRLQLAVANADQLRQAALGRAQSQVDAAQESGDSPQQLAAVELNAVNERLQAEETYYHTLQALYSGDAAKFQEYQTKITQAQTAASKQRAAIAREEQQKLQQEYMQMLNPITSAIQQSVNGMIQGTTTAQQAIRNIGNSIVAEFVADESKKLEAYIAHQMAQVAVANTTESAKTMATVEGNASRVAADQAGQAQSLLVQGESAVKWIMTEAAKAAAGAFNAMVSIPYVGPFLAVGASIAAFAAVSKLVGSVASAEGGWERVPADGMQTVLHKDEMVLPKHVADPMRKAARGGFQGAGGMQVNIQTHTPRDFASYLKRHPQALQAALAHAGRNGW